MKKIWSSPWRPYWIFSFFIIATAATSWWWQATNWQGSRTIASYDFSEIHPQFLAGLEDTVYPKYSKMFHGTSVCKHYTFDDESIQNGAYVKKIGNDLNKYCIRGTALITDVAQNIMDDQQLFLGCCDMNNGGPAHFRYEKKSSGIRACKHFTLKNEHSGVRVFFNELSSHINRFCHPKTVTITEDFVDGLSIDSKQFVTCCEVNQE